MVHLVLPALQELLVGWWAAFLGELTWQQTLPAVLVTEIVQTCHVQFSRMREHQEVTASHE